MPVPLLYPKSIHRLIMTSRVVLCLDFKLRTLSCTASLLVWSNDPTTPRSRDVQCIVLFTNTRTVLYFAIHGTINISLTYLSVHTYDALICVYLGWFLTAESISTLNYFATRQLSCTRLVTSSVDEADEKVAYIRYFFHQQDDCLSLDSRFRIGSSDGEQSWEEPCDR